MECCGRGKYFALTMDAFRVEFAVRAMAVYAFFASTKRDVAFHPLRRILWIVEILFARLYSGGSSNLLRCMDSPREESRFRSTCPSSTSAKGSVRMPHGRSPWYGLCSCRVRSAAVWKKTMDFGQSSDLEHPKASMLSRNSMLSRSNHTHGSDTDSFR